MEDWQEFVLGATEIPGKSALLRIRVPREMFDNPQTLFPTEVELVFRDKHCE